MATRPVARCGSCYDHQSQWFQVCFALQCNHCDYRQRLQDLGLLATEAVRAYLGDSGDTVTRHGRVGRVLGPDRAGEVAGQYYIGVFRARSVWKLIVPNQPGTGPSAVPGPLQAVGPKPSLRGGGGSAKGPGLKR